MDGLIYIRSISAFVIPPYHLHSLLICFFLLSFSKSTHFFQPSAQFKMQFLSTVAVAALLATIISAHPGHDVSHEIETRATFMKTSKRDLAHCVPKMRARGLYHSSIQRRAAVAKAARQKQNLATDALISRLVMKQPSSTPLIWWTEGYTNATDESMIFSGKSSCILSPVIQGPYCRFRSFQHDEQLGLTLCRCLWRIRP